MLIQLRSRRLHLYSPRETDTEANLPAILDDIAAGTLLGAKLKFDAGAADFSGTYLLKKAEKTTEAVDDTNFVTGIVSRGIDVDWVDLYILAFISEDRDFLPSSFLPVLRDSARVGAKEVKERISANTNRVHGLIRRTTTGTYGSKPYAPLEIARSIDAEMSAPGEYAEVAQKEVSYEEAFGGFCTVRLG